MSEISGEGFRGPEIPIGTRPGSQIAPQNDPLARGWTRAGRKRFETAWHHLAAAVSRMRKFLPLREHSAIVAEVRDCRFRSSPSPFLDRLRYLRANSPFPAASRAVSLARTEGLRPLKDGCKVRGKQASILHWVHKDTLSVGNDLRMGIFHQGGNHA